MSKESNVIKHPEVDLTLAELMANLKKKRGNLSEWLIYDSVVLHFMAAVTPSHRILCRGEVHTTECHRPAVLMYDVEHDRVEAWSPMGDNNTIKSFPVETFHSTVPHAGIAREVLFEKSETRTI